MKSIALFLLLSAGSFAVCQAPAPAKPKPFFPMPPNLIQPEPGKARSWHLDQLPLVPHPHSVLPSLISPNHRFDEGMIIHPPKSGFAEQPAQTPLVSKLFPDLKILPIEDARADPLTAGSVPRAEPIPTLAPKYRLEPIPTTWQGFEMLPVESPAKK